MEPPQLSMFSAQQLTSARVLQLFPLLHLQLRRLLADPHVCSDLACESSGEISNSWGRPEWHRGALQRLFSEMRHRSNYTHISATRFWFLQRAADARQECQIWPHLWIILLSLGSTLWSSSVETIKNFQALMRSFWIKRNLCMPQISSRGQCLHATVDLFRFPGTDLSRWF